MIAPPERSAARDAAIGLLLSQPQFPGWSRAALDAALRAAGGEADAALLFPGGAADMVEVFSDLADRAMIAAMTQDEVAPARLSARVREAIARRLAAQRPHKVAVRRAMGSLARPGQAATAAGSHRRTVKE
jgi:ubiquinone biosynthesis protein COQ9